MELIVVFDIIIEVVVVVYRYYSSWYSSWCSSRGSSRIDYLMQSSGVEVIIGVSVSVEVVDRAVVVKVFDNLSGNRSFHLPLTLLKSLFSSKLKREEGRRKKEYPTRRQPEERAFA